MIRVVVIPRDNENFYSQLSSKEKELKTFYRQGAKKAGQQKWKHVSYAGWLQLQKSVGGIMVAKAQAKSPDEEWKILSAFVGLLDRRFRDSIASIHLSYVREKR